MTRRGFTMIELLVAILLLGTVTMFSVLTFNAVSSAWTVSAEYLDKMQRSDYMLEQVVSGLKSMYYPHDGEQDYTYGFYLTDGGSGEEPGKSDTIEWAKTGTAIVGSRNASVDTVHRVQLMVLEEGDNDYKTRIGTTGLYARMCPDPALRPTSDSKVSETDYSFANTDMYEPILVADGIVGFNCRVMVSSDEADADTSNATFEDEFDASNSVPYKVELTFWIADPDGKSYRSNTAPIKRIVRIPIYEQSQDGVALPTDNSSSGSGSSGGSGGGEGGESGGGAGGGAGGGGMGGAGGGMGGGGTGGGMGGGGL